MATNQNATTAQIAAALEWLVEVSGEGDQAIIYFSGHGGVETKTMFQLGYLLTWDSLARTYVAGAFPLQYLQAVVSTLTLQNKSVVALIEKGLLSLFPTGVLWTILFNFLGYRKGQVYP